MDCKVCQSKVLLKSLTINIAKPTKETPLLRAKKNIKRKNKKRYLKRDQMIENEQQREEQRWIKIE